MGTLTGVLLDVSGSMKESACGKIDEEGGEWARSIFEVIGNFVKYDTSPENRLFAYGVGSKYGNGVFDIIKTIEQFQNKTMNDSKTNRNLLENLNSSQTYDTLLDKFFDLMEDNGAQTIQKWATKEVIKEAIPYKMACLLLHALNSDKLFLKMFVEECLPKECKDPGNKENLTGRVYNLFDYIYASTVTIIKQATTEDIKQCTEKAKGLLLKDVGSVYSVTKASEILHGCIDVDELNNYRITELMEIVEPFIYGGTPLCKALTMATQVFSKGEYSKYTKLLFVLSDGKPTDFMYTIVDKCVKLFKRGEELKTSGVIIVSCFVTNSKEIEPKRLYSVQNEGWGDGGKFLFGLSSTIASQLLPRAILIKRGWNIDIINNETKLFLQINNPDNIRDACDLAKHAVCSQDSLSDLMVSVSLDIYINKSLSDVVAPLQKKKTCYANASAAVLHLSMKRILGRDGGYPDFYELREKIIERYKYEGAVTLEVLQYFTKKNRLKCSKVNNEEAKKAIVAKRPVVATFRLTDQEWTTFSTFFTKNPSGILTKAQIDIDKRDKKEKLDGHAVVLVSFNSKCFRFMNSWGHTFADRGFFRVEKLEVLDFKFIDVYWKLEDLTENEIEYYKNHGTEVADKIMSNLKSLQKATYKCPKCKDVSSVVEYTGTLEKAVCPICLADIKCNEAGNMLALNIYLTSVAR